MCRMGEECHKTKDLLLEELMKNSSPKTSRLSADCKTNLPAVMFANKY